MRLFKITSQFLPAALVFSALALNARPQRLRGELHLEVRDPHGAALAASAGLASQANQFHRSFQVGADGHSVAQDLPFGNYRLSLNAAGFAPWSGLIEIGSEVPVRVIVTMGLAPVSTQVQVSDSATLVDADRTGALFSVGRQTMGEYIAPQPGRSISDLVSALPGWLYESNGVLHPRGSEYDVQYVVDGLPFTENRSPAFAPSFDSDDVESMRVLTANYPAEYGRKLGGVVEVTTAKDFPPGLNGQLDMSGGSFATASGSAAVSYTHAKDRFLIAGNGFHTDRYLDPPVLENFFNRATAGGFSSSYERDFSDRDRLRICVSRNVVRFLIPNELVQQESGQRQDRAITETATGVYFQHTISPELFASMSGSFRESAASLNSNRLATPAIVSQGRGYREGYARGDLAGHHGAHDWKVGADALFSHVHEKLQYEITDPSQFDPGTQQQFQFSGRGWDVEPSAYVQDQIRLRHWNVSAGLRFDHYGFLVRQNALSPRFSVSRFVPRANLLIHASYDRVFQTPAVENLLLASSPQLDSVNSIVVRLPVQPARANFYEAGATQGWAGKLRLDANIFRRDFLNYSDDDVLLDTGVSFPIALARGRIQGEEARLEVPAWGRFSGYLSYANQSGRARGPITGGLFLGARDVGGLADSSWFPVSQDQRNTLHSRVRFQAAPRLWLALDGQYGSGLPVDAGDAGFNFLLAQYGAAILDRVNLAVGRVRPSFSLNASAGMDLYRREKQSAQFQIAVSNLSDRVNVINFESLFSGTAVAAPRSVSAGLKLTF
jgi:hypothetical protein